MKTILLDSDICLDVYLDRIPFYEHSARLLEAVEKDKVKGLVSVIALANLYYILKKYKNHKKAIAYLDIFRSYTDIGIINSSIFDQALQSDWNDFEDALQHFCAIEEKCAAIITRNLSDYKKSSLPVFTPAQFLKNEDL